MYANSQYSIGKNLTAGISNTIFTVPTGYEAKVTMVFVTNNTGSTKSFTASWWHDGVEIQFAAAKSLGSKDFIQFGGEFGDFMIMQEGDYMTMTPEAGSTFTTIASFILHKRDEVKFDLTV